MKLAPLLIPLAVAACARSAEPDPTPTNDSGAYNKIDPVPTPTAAAPGTPPNAGEWRQASISGRPGLLFGPPGDARAAAAIYCDERRGLVIERRGLLPTGEIGMMSLVAGNERQDLAVSPVQEESGPVLRAALPFNAELISSLQSGPVPITMNVGESSTLNLPATPLLPQLVNRCRANG